MAIRTGGADADLFDAAALGEFNEANRYSGLAGNDTLIGGGLADFLDGGEGSDRLLGGDGADELVDRDVVGDDRLEGGAGDDIIRGRYGADTLIGGAGHDTIVFGFGSMLVDGGVGDDVFSSIGAGPASATITGGAGDDVLAAGAAADSFDGGQGEDLVDYSLILQGVDINFATGQTGRAAAGDSFRFVEDIIGTRRGDMLIGDGAYNVFFGGAGNDTLGGGFGGDYLDGGDGFDIADLAGGSTGITADMAAWSFGGGGADGDTLLNFEGVAGSDFADQLRGDAAANRLIGRAGNDTLDGGGGVDTLDGGLGSDVYRVDEAGERLIEAANGGVDRVEATVDFSLAAAVNVENLTLVGPAVSGTGNALANLITGNALDNTLDGAGGADTMAGGAGNDSYYVDSAADRIVEATSSGTLDTVFSSVSFAASLTLNSGAYIEKIVLLGTDDIDVSASIHFDGEVVGNSGDNRFTTEGDATITGGEGADTFFLNTFGSPQGPSILDFAQGEDLIELRGFSFGLSPGPLDPNAFHLGATAADGGDRMLYVVSTGQLFCDKDGTGGRFEPRLVATFEPGLELTADDFVVI